MMMVLDMKSRMSLCRQAEESCDMNTEGEWGGDGGAEAGSKSWVEM